jgi:isocitrate dehydrogenase (NAD+)
MSDAIALAAAHFEELLRDQVARVERMRRKGRGPALSEVRPLVVGICPGDGVGPVITRETARVLRELLAAELSSGAVELRPIEGLTLENRLAHRKAIPDDVLEALKRCHVILKAPTTTPEKGGPYPNIESANVAMRRELDLFANVRPVKVPQLGIDWVFFRENTEGAYILGSKGLMVTPELGIDFTAVTRPGCERIIRMAFEHARANGVDRVLGVTKANVIKTTDGLFLEVGAQVAKEYPGIAFESWYADIVAAKLIDPKRRSTFRVFALPNLYGDILSDEAAELQGGVGTAGSANIGDQHAMFEAIHGSAPRMVQEGRAEFADPSSLLRAAVMMLSHVGLRAAASRLEKALDICGLFERRIRITGREDGARAGQLGDYVLEVLGDAGLEARWGAAVAGVRAEGPRGG